MQRVGIEGVFCGIKTPFPSQETVFENSTLFRRTGCSSIVAIGNGALADCAKATRRIVSSGNGSNDHAESFFLAIVPTTISPVHTISSEGLLHKEEDTLIHSVCEPADVRFE